MKKTRNLFVLVFLLPFCIQAQISFGVKGGLNYSDFSDQVEISNQIENPYHFRVGYHLGAFGVMNFSEKLGLKLEVLYNLIGAKNSNPATPNFASNLDLMYLNVPLLLKISPFPKINLNLGPNIGLLINKDEGLNYLIDSELDLALSAGLTYEVHDFLGLHLRYNHSLNTIMEINYTDLNGETIATDSHKNRVFQLSLEYSFLKK